MEVDAYVDAEVGADPAIDVEVVVVEAVVVVGVASLAPRGTSGARLLFDE